jgi:hexosaminidase
MKAQLISLFLVFSAFIISCSTQEISAPAIIPQPVHIEQKPGSFILHPSAEISYTGGEQSAKVAGRLAAMLRRATGYEMKISVGSNGAINLVTDTNLSWQPEEYRLAVEKKKVTLSARTAEGLFRGIQTIRQLLPTEIESDTVVSSVRWAMPCVSITDYPRFAWRGMHLDVSRHFFDVDFIKRYIDILALHKMNVFHWHLVDDQGWRIEIKKYPLLTEVGAWRVDREDKPWDARQPQQPGEKATYGGFYTQEDIKEIVAYAAERYITVVPEIEMPAHVGSAMAAYPQYSCTGGPFTVPPGGVWPITDIYCAGKEETFSFLEDILTEVMDLFPSPYIHIGGDEADKTEWKRCPLCQARIRKEGLKDEDELQSYFIKRIEHFISSKGRHLIGWDEILEGGFAPGAAVMSWRGFNGGIAAAKAQHDVVMTPSSYCYFNVYQGDPPTEPASYSGMLTLKKVYSFEPVPDELIPDEKKYIIGAQGCLWTEYVTDGRTAEHMILPRLTALSEVVWSPSANRDWDDFNKRLTVMMKRFDVMKLNYSRGSRRVDIRAYYDEETNSIMVSLTSEQPSVEIRYTTDGSDPSVSSRLYEKPLPISSTATIRTAVFLNGKMMGEANEKTVNINKATGKKVTYNIPYSNKYKADGDKTLVNGICGSGAFNDGEWQGFEGTDMNVIIDLGEMTPVTAVRTRFMANTGSWIFLPQWVELSLSSDGKDYTGTPRIAKTIRPEDQGRRVIDFFSSFPETKARYVKVFAKGLITCPPWHAGAGDKAWLFCDEIIVE